MKQLVNLFRTSRRNNEKGRADRNSMQRRLRSESLEKRQLLAADVLVAHNYFIAEDVNRDTKVTALDALLVMNHISRNGGSQDLTGMRRGELDRYVDVSGDNRVTPLDALKVINNISRGEGVGERVELRLNARTADDQAFSSTDFDLATRNLNVDVNEIFNLEVQYVDLRNKLTGDLGVFQIAANVLANNNAILEPVLTETQYFEISANIADAASGNLVFRAGSGTETVTVSLADFAGKEADPSVNNPGGAEGTIQSVLADLLNIDESKIKVTTLQGQGAAFLIRFNDFSLANQDLADLSVSGTLQSSNGTPLTISSTNDSVEPRNPDGSVNSEAIGLNLNFLSRTFGTNEQFFGFNGVVTGGYDAAQGFIDVGGVGPLVASVPDAGNGRLIEPFDAFSIPVRVIQATSSLQVTITPPSADLPILVFTTPPANDTDPEEPIEVPPEMVLVNTTNSPTVATDGYGLINIIATNPSVTVNAGDATLTFTEDGAAQTLNLSTLTTVTGSTATPTFAITTQPASGTLSLNGSTITYIPAANVFTPPALTFVYTATAGGSTDTGTVTINITGVNDAPIFVADSAVSATRGVPLTIAASTLLANDLPGPGGETGTVSLAPDAPSSAQGGTVSISGGNLIYTSAANFTGTDTITYTITDGSLTATATLSVNVTAPNVVTVTAADSTLTFNEDGAAQTLNLSTLTTVTGSNTAPTFAIVTQPARGTLTLNGSTVTYTPAANDFTPPAISFVYRATVGSVSDVGTVTVNVTSVNDPPVFTADAAVSATRGVARTITGSTLTANDLPGPSNETGTVTIASVTGTSAQGGTVTLSGQNIIYTSAASFTGADTITYTISDGSLTTTATLTVNVTAPTVVTVVANDTAITINEDTAGTINLTNLTTVTGSTTAPTFTIVTDPPHGTVTIANGIATYTPGANRITGDTPITFVYRATVGSVSDTGTISVSITPVNDAPIFVADAAVSAIRGQALTIAGSTLTANDLPGPPNESGTVTIAGVTATSLRGGTVTRSGQNIIYTSAANFTGADTITYTISDGSLTTTATLQVNVAAPGVISVAAADASLSFVEDGAAQTLNLTTITTVTNSSSVPTFTIVTQPARGTLALSGTTVTYTPAANDFTTTTPLTFVYRATVGSASDVGTVTITISAVNDAPVVGNDTVSARPNLTTTILASTLLANDRPGPANETGTVTLVSVTPISGTTQGTVSISGGNVLYTPPANVSTLTDTFRYTISDGSLTTTGTVTVNVREFVPSTLSGSVFIDYIESLRNPVRDGVRTGEEPAIGGVIVRLTSPANANLLGEAINRTVITNAEGEYRFADLAPGTYTITFEAPSSVIMASSTTRTITIGPDGGLTSGNLNFTAAGFSADAEESLGILAVEAPSANRLAASTGTAFAVLDAEGEQELVQLGDGYGDVVFAEIALSDVADRALLTMVHDDGTVESVVLEEDQFAVSDDRRVVRVFGGSDSFVAATGTPSQLEDEFGDYRDAVDALLATGVI